MSAGRFRIIVDTAAYEQVATPKQAGLGKPVSALALSRALAAAAAVGGQGAEAACAAARRVFDETPGAAPDYVVGYICQQLVARRLAAPDALTYDP